VADSVLNGQRPYWQENLAQRPEMFGAAASWPGQKAVEIFRQEGRVKILELGAGQGRDSLFFAQNGMEVFALDYVASGIRAVTEKAQATGLSARISVLHHDVRDPLPFPNELFDACYSHMLFCMALTSPQIRFLSKEVRRVLKPGGLCVYTVRHTQDPHYGTGVHRGEDMYEVGGFIVHFFSREKVERLAEGWKLISLDEFEEGGLPRKLFMVTMKKEDAPAWNQLLRGPNG
jgi:SAM-dependent methyltransferase